MILLCYGIVYVCILLMDFSKGEDDPYRGPKKKKLFSVQIVLYALGYPPVVRVLNEKLFRGFTIYKIRVRVCSTALRVMTFFDDRVHNNTDALAHRLLRFS